MSLSAGKVCIIIAIVCFVLAAFSVSVGSIAFVPVGLAFFAAGHLIA